MTFDPTAYGPDTAAILGDGRRLMPLGPGTPDAAFRAAIAATTLPPAAVAGLYLYRDLLDESHAVSQDLHTPEGSFWHAVLHRREPDAWNSKYWWRKVGPHPVLKRLVALAPAVGYDYATPHEFVDFCDRVRGTNTPEETVARRVQLLEWQLLFDCCCNSATPRT